MEGIAYKDGKLLGPKPELDRPFADCQPNGEHKNPCVVMFATEFFAMKKDFEETKLRLMQCERDKGQ